MTNLPSKTQTALLLEHDKIYRDNLRRSASTVSWGRSFSSLKFLLTLLKVYVFHYLWLFKANVKLSYRGQKCPDTHAYPFFYRHIKHNNETPNINEMCTTFIVRRVIYKKDYSFLGKAFYDQSPTYWVPSPERKVIIGTPKTCFKAFESCFKF